MLDETDRTMVALLQSNGRLTNQELADAIGLSASQCSRRRAALEAAGAITGYRADLSQEALGLGVTAFVAVSLNDHSAANAGAMSALFGETDAVQEAYALTGDADYLIKVVVEDLPALAALLNDVLLRHEAIARVHSSVALDCLKNDRRLPIPQGSQAARSGSAPRRQSRS